MDDITRGAASALFDAGEVAFLHESDAVKAFGAVLMGRASMLLSGRAGTEVIPDKHLAAIEEFASGMPDDLWPHQCPRCADFTPSNMPELVRNLVDQRELAAYVLANPDDTGARMGLTDAVAEEIAIRENWEGWGK